MQSIGLITVQSFATACLFLGGLFLYDIFFVFKTDVVSACYAVSKLYCTACSADVCVVAGL
jgi:Signal peptide peptidase